MTAPASGTQTATGSGPLAWAGVVLLSLSAILAAGIEALLVPYYVGAHLFPITIVLTLLTTITFPLMARTLVPKLFALVLPFVCWLITIIGFGIVPRPEGDVILPGGPPQWVSYAVILGGALAGTITVVSASPQSQLPAEPPLPRAAPTRSAPAAKAPKRKR